MGYGHGHGDGVDDGDQRRTLVSLEFAFITNAWMVWNMRSDQRCNF